MKNKEHMVENLSSAFEEIEQFIKTLDNSTLHHKPGDQWSIAEELGHLIFSTQGAAFLFGLPVEKHRAAANPSRSYEEIRDTYVATLQKNPIVNNTTVLPADQIQKSNPESMLALWQQSAKSCLDKLQNWTEEDLDQYTVWKHPLIGILTAREMAFFTDYHTRRHRESLERKKNELS